MLYSYTLVILVHGFNCSWLPTYCSRHFHECIFLILSSQQRDPDSGNLGGILAHEGSHEEKDIKEVTDTGRKVGVKL